MTSKKGLKKKGAGTNSTYMTIRNGAITQEWKEFPTDVEADDVQERVNKNGKTVYFAEYESIEGMCEGAWFRMEPDMSDEMRLRMQADDESYVVCMYVDGPYFRSFAKLVPNIDLTLPFEIKPYDFETKDGKRMVGVTVYQDGEKVLPAFTRDNPNGLPEAVQKVKKGKKVWDFSDQEDFLWDVMQDFCAEVLELHPRKDAESAPDDELPSEKAKAKPAAKSAPAPAKPARGAKPAPVEEPEEEEEEEDDAPPARRTRGGRTAAPAPAPAKPAARPARGAKPAPEPEEEEEEEDDAPPARQTRGSRAANISKVDRPKTPAAKVDFDDEDDEDYDSDLPF